MERMKLHLIIVLFMASISLSTGQTPSPMPTPSASPERSKLKNFGSSLKRFGDAGISKNENDRNLKPDEETIRVETNLVLNDILVVNQKGNAVKGLEANNFIIFEDENEQEVKVFSFGNNTDSRSIVLIIDYSGSQLPFIKTSVEAAKILVDKLSPQDRLAIVTADVKLLADFTQDKPLLKKKLDSLNYKAQDPAARAGWYTGHSLPYSALLATLQELFNREDKPPIVILQTDGDELDVLKPISDNRWWAKSVERNFTLKDIYETVEKSNTTIYGIIPGVRMLGLPKQDQIEREKAVLKSLPGEWLGKVPGSTKMANSLLDTQIEMGIERTVKQQETLAKIVRLSSGYTNFLEKPEDAESIYSDILTVVNNRYIIGYYSTNQKRDEKPRKIKIEVRGHPELKILGRTSYIAP